jgi:CRISPR-associated helicase Cas3/CRISPR-associated endonuclease Cas3-HD
MPLVVHAADACAVAQHLFDHWLPRSARAVIAAGRGEDEVRALVGWLAAVHDSGKLSAAFACQLPGLADVMRGAGLPISVHRDDVGRCDFRHAVVGQVLVEQYLCGLGWARIGQARPYAVVAGGHHGCPPDHVPKVLPVRMIGGAAWDAVRAEFFEYAAEVSGARGLLASWRDMSLSVPQQVLLTALVIAADWIASNQEHFPLAVRRDSAAHAVAAMARLGLPAPWRAVPVVDGAEALEQCGLAAGTALNPMQAVVLEAARALRGAGMLIVEAPMGSGKTEAALMAARQLAADGGHGGVFMALPTMATSNAAFDRVLTWLRAQHGVGQASAFLAHGKADLHDAWRGLLESGVVQGVEADCCGGSAVQVLAHQWLSGRRKGLLAGFTVGTIDQLLAMALQARFVMLRHLAFVGKVVIIDEAHASDEFMGEYLAMALEWLGAYRVPVIMLSATLPSRQWAVFVEAYSRGCGAPARSGSGQAGGYPAVTAVGVDGTVRVTTIPSSSGLSAAVEVVRLADDDTAVATELRELLRDGGCAAVIRNTVGRAQRSAAVLREVFGDDVVVVLHSGFVARQRADLEDLLRSELSREGYRPWRRVVVATQVVEQSLDVDFDVLVADVAPMDLVLQRMGRLHRHSRVRPSRLMQPRVYLTGVADWGAAPPVPVAVSEHVYSRYDLLCALAVLDGRDQVQVPDDIDELVQEAFCPEFVAPQGWEQIVEDARRQADQRRARRVARAADFRIWAPRARPHLVGWLAHRGSDPDDANGYARVRDSGGSLEVIVTVRDGGRVRLPAPCGDVVIDPMVEPDDVQARIIRQAAVRLPYVLTHPGILSGVIDELGEATCDRYPGWRSSKWLAGDLVIELDSQMRTTLCGFDIRYDLQDGLMVQRAAVA